MKRLLVALVSLCTLLPAGSALAADDPDRIVIDGPVLVDRGERAGDVVVLHGNVNIRGVVRGDVIVVDGDVAIRGLVRGDVVTISGTATLGRRARIDGDIVYFDEKPKVASGAKVGGDTKKYDGGEIAGVGGAFAIGFWLAVTLSMLVLGLLLILLAPRAAEALGRTAKRSWGASIGVGILVVILLPVIAIAACVTILGLPLGIVLLSLLIPLYAIAYVTAALVVGRLILKKSTILAFVVGLVILRLLALIPIAGGLISGLLAIFGLGVLFVTLFRARGAKA